MRDFFSELSRRHVYKVAVFYAAVAWVTVQIADLALENFNASDRMMQGVILVAALGFPVALLLAWMYDLGPRGITRTPPPEEVGKPPVEDRPGIVVLPFDSFSERTEDIVLSSGFTEDLTTLLAHIAGYFVISRNSARVCKEQGLDVREIGRELGARYVLEGSLRRMDDGVRVTAQLILAEDGSPLWADHCDASVDELPKVQDELVRNIALQLGTELARAEFSLARRRDPSDMDAWSLYQQARGAMQAKGWSEESLQQATETLRRAISIDPDYPASHAYLAFILALGRVFELVEDPQLAHDEAIACAELALKLDSGSSELLGYAGCAFTDLGYHQRGVPLIERAIELDPSNAQAHAGLGAAKIVTGQLEEGIADFRQAIKISPRDPGLAPWSALLSMGCAYSGRKAEMLEWARLACKTDTRFFPGHIALAYAHLARGDTGDAQDAMDTARKLYPGLSRAYVERSLGPDVLSQFDEAGIGIDA